MLKVQDIIEAQARESAARAAMRECEERIESARRDFEKVYPFSVYLKAKRNDDAQKLREYDDAHAHIDAMQAEYVKLYDAHMIANAYVHSVADGFRDQQINALLLALANNAKIDGKPARFKVVHDAVKAEADSLGISAYVNQYYGTIEVSGPGSGSRSLYVFADSPNGQAIDSEKLREYAGRYAVEDITASNILTECKQIPEALREFDAKRKELEEAASTFYNDWAGRIKHVTANRPDAIRVLR